MLKPAIDQSRALQTNIARLPVNSKVADHHRTLVLDGEVLTPDQIGKVQIEAGDLEPVAAKIETDAAGNTKTTLYLASKKYLKDIRMWMLGGTGLAFVMWAYKAGVFKKLGL
jgi:hypothetical protein